jgi:tRNA (cmo5U34)-methyltransferase
MKNKDSNTSFDFNTIQDFDSHILKSIPNYDVLISSIKSISEYFFVDNCNVYDLGCSTGKLLKSLNCNCDKIGYDNSSLLPQEAGFINVDLNESLEINSACVVYSIFTMQFLKPTNRERYLKSVFDGMINGGCFIICEKVYQNSGKVQEVLSFSHYDYKLKQFDGNEILAKERDLRFIMKPCGETELEGLLKDTGFSIVSQFWQMFNFKAYLAIK